MQAEIITIGDEILIGQILDTNSAFISKALNAIGVSVEQISSIQDKESHILEALALAQKRANFVIVTGGLGPTKDDVTKKAITIYFNDRLVQDKAVLNNIKTIWKTYVKKPLLQANIDQALVPLKATVLMNLYGTAPGMWIEKQNTTFIFLPGVPYEMKALINNQVLSRLKRKFKLPHIIHKTILTYGLGESMIAERIAHWENNLPKTIKLAYLPNFGNVRLRLSAKGEKATVENAVENSIKKLLPLIDDIFVGFEDEEKNIVHQIAKQFTLKNKTLAVVESCTGGKIAQQITQIPGASKYFKGGLVCYTEAVKKEILKIQEKTIKAHSVVSKQVALEMANQGLKTFNVDYCLATTGNAGPTKDKNSTTTIGTVHIALASKNNAVNFEFSLGNQREKVINKATNKAFEIVLKEISKIE